MKFVVLNGSPKGLTSVTMQYVRFLQKRCPQHEFMILPIASELRHLEDSLSNFQQSIDAVAAVEAVLWAFPLYVLLVHAHYNRFIELIGERHVEAAFRGKYAAALSTSSRFFDHTAHHYVQGICDDLDMHYWGGYSAEMYDLVKDEEQRRFLRFAEDFFVAVRARTATAKVYAPVQPHPWANLRFVFHADHRYYRQHGWYDFPRRSLKQRLMTAAVTLLIKIPAFRNEFLKRIRTEMIKPLEKIVDGD